MRNQLAVLTCFLGLLVGLVGTTSHQARAAGDASAIRRATHTEDVGWVSNYRPHSSNSSRRYSYSNRGNYHAVRSTGCHGRK